MHKKHPENMVNRTMFSWGTKKLLIFTKIAI